MLPAIRIAAATFLLFQTGCTNEAANGIANNKFTINDAVFADQEGQVTITDSGSGTEHDPIGVDTQFEPLLR